MPPAPSRAVARILAGVLLVLLATTGCARRVVDLRFTDAAGEPVRVRVERRPSEQARAARSARVGRTSLAPRHAVPSTALLVLKDPLPLDAGQAVTVAVRSGLEAFTVELFSGADTVAHSERVELGGSGTIHYQFTVGAPLTLWGMQLRAPPAVASGELELRGVAVGRPSGALRVRDAVLMTGSGFRPRGAARFDGLALSPVDLALTQWLFPPAGQDADARRDLGWLLALELHNGSSGELRIDLEGNGTRRSFLLTTHAGRQFVHLHGGEIGFLPHLLTLAELPRSGAPAGLVSAAVEAAPAAQAADELVALPADLGTVLSLRREFWRRPEFELYAWNAVPGAAAAPILVFDTADYAVQSRLFRRLAFFVEKRGFRGRLLDDEELAGRRGYNAHDYTAPDLARFFSLAQEGGLRLTDEELLLRAVAQTHGIIQPDPDGGWRAGAGAILSISQASGASLRRLLLRHEAMHGLYFIHPAYREAVWALWQELTADEQMFWRLLLAAVNYDIDYPDLVANEFQAYLLQQDVTRVDGFLNLWGGRLRVRHPQHADAIAAVVGATARWRELHRRTAAALAATTGVRSDLLIRLSAADG